MSIKNIVVCCLIKNIKQLLEIYCFKFDKLNSLDVDFIFKFYQNTVVIIVTKIQQVLAKYSSRLLSKYF